MAITGALVADFSSFETAVKKAEVSLKGMEGGAVKVGTALDTMTEGGVAPLNTLRESFGQVDQVLSASGVNVGKYARGLMEIGEMSGKTVGSIGLLATGASIFAAAMAGWQFGTWIAGITGLDKAVEKYADSLTNLPAEIAAAKQDTINFAIRNGAAATISYTDAIEFNAKAVGRTLAQQTDWNAVLGVAQQRVAELTAAEIADIAVMQRANATTAEIITKHDISALGLKLLAERQKQAGKDADEHTAALEKQKAATEKAAAAYNKLMSEVKNANQLALMEEEAAAMKQNAEQAAMFAEQDIKARIKRQQAVTDQAAAEAAAETARIAANQAEIDGLLAAGKAHTDAGNLAKAGTDKAVVGQQQLAQQITITGDAIKEWINLMKYSAQVQAIQSENSLFTSTSQKQRIAGLGSFGGGGTVNNNTFNLVDNTENLARKVAAQITDGVTRGGPV